MASFIALVCSLSLNAQQSTGSINGTVRDASGAVVSNATVTLTNVNTSVSRTQTTNGVGLYIFNNILPGSYTLRVDQPGFRSIDRTGIKVEVNQTATFDFALQVGSQTQTVDVRASVVQLEASTAELGTVITTKTVNDLPLNGRNFTALLTLTPGASPANTTQTSFGGEASPIGVYSFPAMNGQGNRSNYFMLDGIDDNEFEFSTFAVAPTLDDIQEFKVQSHNDEAEYGDVLGGVVNVVTKSGTNQLHGTLWEFLRNSAFDADDPLTFTNTPLHQNQYGLNLGGPVLIPHLYDGRSKTFFYGSYEAFRVRTAAAAYIFTPTMAERSGDFSALTTQLYNPFTTRPDPAKPGSYLRDPFPGNNISSEIDPAIVTYANLLWPLPNISSPLGNLIDRTPAALHQNEWNARVDETLNNSNSMWFRYSSMNQPSSSSGGFPGYLAALDVKATNYGFNYLHTFSPTMTLDAQFGRDLIANLSSSRFLAGSAASINSQVGFATNFGCGFMAEGLTTDCFVPSIDPAGYINGGSTISYHNPLTDMYQWNADFMKVLGHHLLQTGFLFQRNTFFLESGNNSAGFDASQTSDPEIPGTGNALASAFIGVPENSLKTSGLEPIHGLKSFAFYGQDQWKALPNLTFNVGVRYALTAWPIYGLKSNLSDAVGTIDFNNGTYILQTAVGSCAQLGVPPCIPGGLASQTNVVISPNGHLWQNADDNVQPRLGFALQTSHADVIRGAVGLFFDQWAGVLQHSQAMEGAWPAVGYTQNSNQNTLTSVPTVTATNPLNGVTTFPAQTPFKQQKNYREPNGRDPAALQWNLGIQHLVTSRTNFEIDYVGSYSKRLVVGGEYNVALTPGPGNPVLRQPFPDITYSHYDRYVGRGNYNALQAKLTRSPVHGLGYILSYTWSKAMDTGCDGIQDVEGCSVQNPYDLRQDRSAAGFDLPNIISVAVSYELPIGTGKYLTVGNGVLNGLVGGWQINGIYSYTSGLAYNLSIGGDIANTGNSSYERLDVIGNPKLSNPIRSKWFNTAAFAAPAQFTFGNEGRNDLRQDPYNDLDASIFKNFPIRGEAQLQFRIEAFNSLNHITYGAPGEAFGTPSFGVVSSTRSTQRELQLSLKAYF
jgi:hypothetical protein